MMEVIDMASVNPVSSGTLLCGNLNDYDELDVFDLSTPEHTVAPKESLYGESESDDTCTHKVIVRVIQQYGKVVEKELWLDDDDFSKLKSSTAVSPDAAPKIYHLFQKTIGSGKPQDKTVGDKPTYIYLLDRKDIEPSFFLREIKDDREKINRYVLYLNFCLEGVAANLFAGVERLVVKSQKEGIEPEEVRKQIFTPLIEYNITAREIQEYTDAMQRKYTGLGDTKNEYADRLHMVKLIVKMKQARLENPEKDFEYVSEDTGKKVKYGDKEIPHYTVKIAEKTT